MPCIGALFHLARLESGKEPRAKRNRGVITDSEIYEGFHDKTRTVRNRSVGRSVGRRLIKAPEEEHWQVETERGAREPAGPPIKERKRELFSFAISALVRLLPWPCKRPSSRARAQTQSANVRSGTRVNPKRASERRKS